MVDPLFSLPRQIWGGRVCGKIDVSSSSFRLALHPSIRPLPLSPRPHALPFFSVVFGEDFAMTQREREREMLVVMGRGLFGELLRLTIFFSPQILLPPNTHFLLSPATPPLFFIPPFVCTVG